MSSLVRERWRFTDICWGCTEIALSSQPPSRISFHTKEPETICCGVFWYPRPWWAPTLSPTAHMADGLWYSGREGACASLSWSLWSLALLSSLQALSHLSLPLVPGSAMLWTGWAISFATGLAHPPLRVIGPFTHHIINMTHFFFSPFLLIIAGNLFDQSVNHEPNNKKISHKAKRPKAHAVVAFLCEGRREF